MNSDNDPTPIPLDYATPSPPAKFLWWEFVRRRVVAQRLRCGLGLSAVLSFLIFCAVHQGAWVLLVPLGMLQGLVTDYNPIWLLSITAGAFFGFAVAIAAYPSTNRFSGGAYDAFSVLSAALCIVTAILWMQSYTSAAMTYYYCWNDSGAIGRHGFFHEYALISGKGSFTLAQIGGWGWNNVGQFAPVPAWLLSGALGLLPVARLLTYMKSESKRRACALLE